MLKMVVCGVEAGVTLSTDTRGETGCLRKAIPRAEPQEIVKGLMRCYWKGLFQSELDVHLHHTESQSDGVEGRGQTST